MTQENFDIIAFRSRQHAFRFNQILKNEGYRTQIMSTPKDVALGCGLSIRFSSYMTPGIINIYKKYKDPILGFYRIRRYGNQSSITRIPYQ